MAKLRKFRKLIATIPIALHSVEVEKKFWEKEFKAAKQTRIFVKIFGSKPSIRISRNKIIKTSNGAEKCALILLWGYSKRRRGNHHNKYLNNLSRISKVCSSAHKIWNIFYKSANQIDGLGISTITKLAYFHGLKFDGNPALIIDQRIINVLSKSHWEDLESLSDIEYRTADKRYDDFLQTIKYIASKLDVKGAQLEFFLFSMGNAFD